MAHKIGDLVAQRVTAGFVGRTAEQASLLETLEEGGPLMVFIHGIAGIGKSSLLAVFVAQARAKGATVLELDCRAIEPTERAFLHEIGTAAGGDPSTLEQATELLARLQGRVVLALDTYEVFRTMDTWLRQVFLPVLPDNIRLVLASREPPVSAWLAAPGWEGTLRVIALGPLDDNDTSTYFKQVGIGQKDARRVNWIARGHPLALRLASSVVELRPSLHFEDTVLQRVVEELTRLYLVDVEDPLTRKALEAVSVVRRTTLSLLNSLLPGTAPQDVFERLRSLPFVEMTRDGLHVHDAVQQAIATGLRSADPARYRDYRRRAWRQLREELRTAGTQDLWRYTADMLYILENPAVRESFFPSGVHDLAVEPARTDDGPAIHAISVRHETHGATRLVEAWWARAPQTFRVVRDSEGAVTGFFCLFAADAVDSSLLRIDPILQRWQAHLQRNPVPKGQRVLFHHRWLSRDNGEAPSPVQGATWLEVKRTYMEMRPKLRRIYVAQRDVQTQAEGFQQLGLRRLPEADLEIDGVMYHTIMLDFGPSSVDGWLAGLVAAELGIQSDDLLDSESHELVIEGERIPLTRLEFGVMQYLYYREGKAVARQSLLTDVWSSEYEGGSNVVDVVIRALRKKLRDRAAMIQTVSGVGYRFRRN